MTVLIYCIHEFTFDFQLNNWKGPLPLHGQEIVFGEHIYFVVDIRWTFKDVGKTTQVVNSESTHIAIECHPIRYKQ